MNWIILKQPANWISFSAVAISLASIYLADSGWFAQSWICLIAAGVLDMLDGMVARRFATSLEYKELGLHVDSFCDAINFGLVPILLVAIHTEFHAASFVIGVIYLVAVIMRLSLFNTHGLLTFDDIQYYRGLPVTYAALFFPIFFIILSFTTFSFFWLNLCSVILVFLYLSSLPIKKPKYFYRYFLFILAFCMSILLFLGI
ncbi:MAG: CDP-alcohol phosphatidyltransferase family protein [Candidatus Thiodiazotropha sp.]